MVFAKNLRKRTRKMQGVSPTLPKENLIFFYTTSCVPFHLERCFFIFFLGLISLFGILVGVVSIYGVP